MVGNGKLAYEILLLYPTSLSNMVKTISNFITELKQATGRSLNIMHPNIVKHKTTYRNTMLLFGNNRRKEKK